MSRFEARTTTQTFSCEEEITNSPVSTRSTAANLLPNLGDNSKTLPCRTMDLESQSTTANRGKAVQVAKLKRRVHQLGSSQLIILTKSGKHNQAETLWATTVKSIADQLVAAAKSREEETTTRSLG